MNMLSALCRASQSIGNLGSNWNYYWTRRKFDSMDYDQWINMGRRLHGKYVPNYQAPRFGDYKPSDKVLSLRKSQNPEQQKKCKEGVW